VRHALLALMAATSAAAFALWWPGVDAGSAGDAASVIWQLRLPRVIAAACSGAALGVTGLALQTLFRNPLADPYVLGTSGGAAVGGLLAMIAGISVWAGAVAGAAASVALLWLIGWRVLRSANDDAPDGLLLAGVMIAAFSGAAVQLLLSWLPDAQLRGAVYWLLGDLSGAIEVLPLAAAALIVLLLALSQARAFVWLAHGSQEAFLLGLDVRRAQHVLLLLAALATSAVVASVGALGFVGLVAPHLARRWVGWTGGYAGAAQVCTAASLGALLVLLADLLARTVVAPLELPAGAVLALVGAPFFVWLLLHERRFA
jgi:iron complex transport system permease protein